MHILGIFTLLIAISKILAVPEANCSNYYLLIEESIFSFDPVAVDDADLKDLDPHIPRQCYLNLMCGPISETNCVDIVKSDPKMGKDVFIRDPLNPIQPTTAIINGTTTLESTTMTTGNGTTNDTTPGSTTSTTNGTTLSKPTTVATNGSTTPKPTKVATNGTTPLEPPTMATNGTTLSKPTTVATVEITSSEPTKVASNATTPSEPTTVANNVTNTPKPTAVTTNGTTSFESTTLATNGTTLSKPTTVATNRTTPSEPTTVATNGTTPLKPTTVATNGTTTPKPTTIATNRTISYEPTTLISNGTTTEKSTTVVAYTTTTLKPMITTYKITTLKPEVTSNDTDRESLLPERCNKKFKQYILSNDCGERIDRNYKSTVFYQCDSVPYKECTGHDVDEKRLRNLTRVLEYDETYKKCQHFLIHTILFDLDGLILYHPLDLLTAKFEDIPCADYNTTCILKFECTNIGEYCIRTYRYQGTKPKQNITTGNCFTKKTSITDAPTIETTTPGITTTAVSTTTAKNTESPDNADDNIFYAFIRRKPTEDLLILFAFLAIGQLALTILIYVIVTRIKWKRESDRYVEEISNDTALRQLPPANIF